MTIITEEIVEETGDADTEILPGTIQDSSGRVEDAMGETVEDAAGETVEDAVGETMEDAAGETVEDTVEDAMGETAGKIPGQIWRAAVAKMRRRYGSGGDMGRPGRRKASAVKIQGGQWKRMAGWLAPYVAAFLLIVLAGGAILLATGMKTDRLTKQIQEQYGEYFTDGK